MIPLCVGTCHMLLPKHDFSDKRHYYGAFALSFPGKCLTLQQANAQYAINYAYEDFDCWDRKNCGRSHADAV